MTKYTKLYCECKEWIEAEEECNYDRGKLYTLLKHYPGECPFCHQELKTRPCVVTLLVSVEPRIGRNPYFMEQPISLEEFKELLGLEGGEK